MTIKDTLFFSCPVKLLTHIFEFGEKFKPKAEASVGFLHLLAKLKIVNNKHILTLAAYNTAFKKFS